jgi:hypothetical protein
MTTDRIRELVELLPAQNAYAARPIISDSLSSRRQREVSVFAHALTDPQFGWMFVKAHVDARKTPACQVTEPGLLRAFCFHQHDVRDDAVLGVMMLRTKEERVRRCMLHCMLLVEKYSFEQIAGELCLPVDVITTYETLFWNVRDRLVDKVYIAAILFPDSTQLTWIKDYHLTEDFQALAMRAASLHGVDIAKAFLGLQSPMSDFDAEGHAKAFESHIASMASYASKLGLLMQPNVPAIAHGRGLLQSIKQGGAQSVNDDDRVGVGGMSLQESMLDHFKRVTEPDLQYRLQLQRLDMANALNKAAN